MVESFSRGSRSRQQPSVAAADVADTSMSVLQQWIGTSFVDLSIPWSVRIVSTV